MATKKRHIAFELSMPSRGSWNGKWSGESRFYCIVRAYRDGEKVDRIIAPGSYYYAWSDGWAASVRVREVDRDEARKLTKRSNGFCGYDWMVDSIIDHGRILASHELPATAMV